MLIAVVLVVVIAAVAFAVYYEATRYVAGSPQRGALALVGATVLEGDELEALPDGVVLIRDGVIVAVGSRGEVDVPSDATTFDVSGHTVLPGLIDLHVHLGSPALEARQVPSLADLPASFLESMRLAPGHRRSALEHGVTTVRNVGDDAGWIADLRSQIGDGTLEGPRVFASGPVFTTAGGHPIATVGVDATSDVVRVPSSPDDARQMVRALATGDRRVDLIKLVHDRGSAERPLEPFAPDVLAAVVAEAHAHGLAVTAHWGTLDDVAELLAVGIDGLEHIESRDLLTGWPPEVLAALVDAGLPLTPTLTVSEAALPPHEVAGALAALQRRVGELHAAGGWIVVGTDAGRPGVRFGDGVHRELELLVASGLTPTQALRAATVDAARVLGADDLGVIAPGRAADLVVVAGDPTVDIAAIRGVLMTLRDGRPVVDRRGGG